MKNQIKAELTKLVAQLKPLVKKINELRDGDWPAEFDRNNPDDMFELNTLLHIGEYLDKMRWEMENMNAPIVDQGKLRKNSAGRYELNSGDYYTSGRGIEFLHTYSDGEKAWVTSRVEHNGEDYFIVSHPGIIMDGLRVRLRERKLEW